MISQPGLPGPPGPPGHPGSPGSMVSMLTHSSAAASIDSSCSFRTDSFTMCFRGCREYLARRWDCQTWDWYNLRIWGICYSVLLCSPAGWTWIWSQRRQGGRWSSRTTSKWSWVTIDRTGLSCMSHWCWSPQTTGSTRLPRLAGVCGTCGSSRSKGREGKLEDGASLGVNLSMLLMKYLRFVLLCVSREDLENLDSMWVCHQSFRLRMMIANLTCSCVCFCPGFSWTDGGQRWQRGKGR